MFTVSLIGPDGVGKTTIAKKLESSLPLPVKYTYMGLNSAAANITLPTTRLINFILSKKPSKGGSSDFSSSHEVSGSPSSKKKTLPRQGVRFIRKTLGLTNLIFEQWYRQLIAYTYLKFGHIVIFDRHFIYDFYDFNNGMDKKALNRKIHDFVRNKTMSEPDLVICLDAPGEVVFNRKGEFNIKYLEDKRKEYISLQTVVKNFVVIDANRELDLVIKDVGDQILQFHKSFCEENHGSSYTSK